MAHSVEITHDRGGYFQALEDAYNFCGSDLDKDAGMKGERRDACVEGFLKGDVFNIRTKNAHFRAFFVRIGCCSSAQILWFSSL